MPAPVDTFVRQAAPLPTPVCGPLPSPGVVAHPTHIPVAGAPMDPAQRIVAERLMEERAEQIKANQAFLDGLNKQQAPAPTPVYYAPGPAPSGLAALGYSPEHASELLTPLEPIHYRPPQWGKWHGGGHGHGWGGGRWKGGGC